MSFTKSFLEESLKIIQALDEQAIEAVAKGLARVRDDGGRLFILGVGGSAASASHAVNDFRKLCAFEAYAPTDNVSELTAWVNDFGWESCFAHWLEGSRISSRDALLVVSVGGGNTESGVSQNLVAALTLAKEREVPVFGVVGRDGGYTKTVAKACVVIPTVNQSLITPHVEGISSVVLHLLVSHPSLLCAQMKWESLRQR